MLNQNVTAFLGTDSPTDEDWNSKVDGLLASNDTLETENAGYKEEVAALKAEIAALEELRQKAELGEQYLADTREATLTAYRKVKGEKASEAMVSAIEAASLEQAKALLEEFEAEVEKKFPLKCESCGAESLSRRSSVEEGVDGDDAASEDESKFKLENGKEA